MHINRIGKGPLAGSFEVQIAASVDDGYWYSSTFSDSDDELLFGVNATSNAYARWDGFKIPAGATILEAYVSVYLNSVIDTNTSRIYFNDVAAPTAPTNLTTAAAKVKTTAYVNFALTGSGWKTSNNIASVIQELVDTHGSLTSAMMLIGYVAGGNWVYIRSYNYAGNLHGPKLYVRWG